MIRFDEHGVFELTRADLLDTVNGAGPLPDLPNVGCPHYYGSSDLACGDLGGPVSVNVICGPNTACIDQYDNVACQGEFNTYC
jgi:hypothetical protein